MKEIEISVILPTRNRIDLLWDLIYNLHEKTSKYDNIEIIIGYDYDDDVTKNFLLDKNFNKDKLVLDFGENLIDIKLIEFDFRGNDPDCLGKENHHRHFDILSKEVNASKWIWMTADDCRVLTDKWDDVLRSHAPSTKGYISQGMFNNIPGYWAYGMRNDLETYIAITPILTADLFKIFSDIWLTPLDCWFWALKDRIKILHTMDKILDVEHRSWGAKKGEPGCSTNLRRFMKDKEWNESLDLAVKRFNELKVE